MQAKPSPRRAPYAQLGKALGPVLSVLTMGTLLACWGVVTGTVPPATYALVLVVTALTWIGGICYLTARCIIRAMDRKAAKVLKGQKEGIGVLAESVRLLRIEVLSRETPTKPLRSVN